MKRIALLLLLRAWAVAAPLDPPDSPGRERTSLEIAGSLDKAEANFRRGNDQAGLLEVECLRLESGISKFDPSCPARVQAIESASASLPPGPARARGYWVRGLYAGLLRQFDASWELKKLACLEPATTPLWRARCLARMADYRITRPQQLAWLESQLQKLLESEPDPPTHWLVLAAQRSLAGMRGQKDLVETLLRAQLDLATRQGWPLEQMQCHLALHDNHWRERIYWDRALAIAQKQRRDEWTRKLLRTAPTQADWQRAVSLLKAPRKPSEQARDWLAWGRREQFDQVDQRVTYRRDLVDEARQKGDVEEELSARQGVYFALRDASRTRDSLRELKAAVQFRLDHPPAAPDWVDRELSLGGLGNMLISELTNSGQDHQAQAWAERALREHWATLPNDLARLLRTASERAELSGEVEQAEEYARQALPVAAQQPPEDRIATLEWLAEKGPEEQRTACLNQAQTLVQGMLKSPFPGRRGGFLYEMERLTRKQSGNAQTLQFWLNQFEQAEENGDAATVELCSAQLLYAYRRADRHEEFKELALSLLKQPATSLSLRLSCLEGCDLLARHGDPLALEWAEEYLRLALPRHAKRRGLQLKAMVLEERGRTDEALACLDQAQALLSPKELSIVEGQRIELLWKAKRQTQACQALDAAIERVLHSEDPMFANGNIRRRALYARELRQDWEGQLEKRILQYQAMGESGQFSRDFLLGAWLKWLAEDQQWEKGREVLARYPWQRPGSDATTKKLRSYPQWSELFPAAKDRPSAARTAETLQQVVDELRLQQPELGQLLSLRSTNLKHLQAQLGPQDTLVTYCQQGGRLYLLALRPKDGFFRKYPLVETELQGTLKRYLDGLRSDQIGDSEASLHKLLLEPVLTDDPQQRIFLVPNGPLWQVPFGALRDPQGRSAASRAQLVMLGSGDLLRLADGDWKPYQLSHPLAIGAPPAADLPGAYAELGEVARLLPGCQLRRGDQATLISLYERDQKWGLLHFATHAHYHPDRPIDSDIELHDGNLQVKQLSQLSLSDHALVALSVCQGGASKGQRLDEPVTLATGFSAAGAETVVANLWSVDDDVARLFFTAFYHELSTGSSPGFSFREAQQQCRQTYPKARDWAGFFLLGNPG